MTEIDNNTLADLIYESSMYKLHQLETLNMVKKIWDSIDIEADQKKEKKRKNCRIKSVELLYKRWQDE